jgi:hypothetical protein
VADLDLIVQSRAALLDALDALAAHRESLIVIGAQAVYLRTSTAPVALAEATKDSDIAIDPRQLKDDPLIESAMTAAGFIRDPNAGQPGAWLSRLGYPVDLMVPELLAGAGGAQARGARIPPHDRHATRRARGLEASVIDNDVMRVNARDESDRRHFDVRVAGAAALLVAKVHKIAERAASSRHRLVDKDAHDIYRLLIDVETTVLAKTLRHLLTEELSARVTADATMHLGELFARGPEALGSTMAGRAEEGIGEPATVSLQVSILSADLLAAIG